MLSPGLSEDQRDSSRRAASFGSRNRLTSPTATVEQAARLSERRLVDDVAAFAFPCGVPTAGTRQASDDHVSRQQPVAPRTAVRSSFPVRSLKEADEVVVNINSHSHHTGIQSVGHANR